MHIHLLHNDHQSGHFTMSVLVVVVVVVVVVFVLTFHSGIAFMHHDIYS